MNKTAPRSLKLRGVFYCRPMVWRSAADAALHRHIAVTPTVPPIMHPIRNPTILHPSV